MPQTSPFRSLAKGTNVPFMIPADVAPQVQSLALFAGISREGWREVLRAGVVRDYPAGRLLWSAGGEARGLFVILSGAVRVVRAPAGRQHVVHHASRGGTLGEVPLFANGSYPATAIAAQATRCLVLDRDTIARVVERDPAFAFALLAGLARRVQGLVQRLDDRDGLSVRQRLARLLLERQSVTGVGSFTIGRTQAEAAEEIDTVREVLVRSLREMVSLGVVTVVSRGRYRVMQRRALERIAAVTI